VAAPEWAGAQRPTAVASEFDSAQGGQWVGDPDWRHPLAVLEPPLDATTSRGAAAMIEINVVIDR
jgi:hypothetical protein